MSAAVHLVRGPALSGKTRRMGERFRLIAAGNAEAALWLAPDFRTADALRDRFLSEAATGFSPRVLALQDFVDLIVGANDPTARPLPRVQQRLLVEETVRELQAAKLLPHFGLVLETRGFLEGVISLVSELDDCAIDPEELCESAVGDKHTQCARIYAHYRRHVDRLAVYDTGARIRRAKELLHEGKRRPFDGLTAVFVDGFAGFTSCQNAILSVLCPWVTELWIALPGEELGRRDEVFSRASAAALASRGRDPTEYCLPPADADRAGRPAGLGHLERQLFRPVREVERSTSADGLLILEAPGELGEARMVARSIKALLLDNIPAEDIVVTLRDAELSAELLEEVFGEYGVPVDIEGSRPLSSQGAVSFLLRAAALPEDDFAFAGVTALLRSTWLRPEWEETAGQSNLLQQAEVLLRLIDKPKGLQAYLKSLDYWADQAKANEDEEPVEASRRKRKEQLATRCRPFLRRFFAAWEGAPGKAPLESHITWLQHLAEELGLSATAQEEAGNAKAWQRFWHELDAWQRLEARLHEEPISLDRFAFLHRLAVIAREAGVARTPRGPGRVRILSAPLARNLSVPRLFIMGLGEWGFPQVSAAEPFFEEVERQAYRASGLQLSTADERLADEMLLFYQLVTRPQQGLVLSYSAVDSNGQELLPSTFLTAVRDCFEPEAVAVERRVMLLDGLRGDRPLCPPEQRVRVALQAENATFQGLPARLADRLVAAQVVASQRFARREHGIYDGRLRQPELVGDLGERFGPQHVFSPTALEEYIACPFRFFLNHVLRLEPLEEPAETIEGADRGLVMHRALSRLHNYLHDSGIDRPDESVNSLLRERLDGAIAESAHHSSAAATVLWDLEGQRLRKRATRYQEHWKRFIDDYRDQALRPVPLHFEKSFGLDSGAEAVGPLVIRADGIEVRVGGRIDRVDVAKHADGWYFWIIDYKTGRSGYYSPAGIKAFEKLQLTLYALAAERLLFSEEQARPLGLAYWLVIDSGAKVVLPGKGRTDAWFAQASPWEAVRADLETLVARLARHIRQGDFPLGPRSVDCTATCDFGQMCRISQARAVDKPWSLELPVIQ